MDQTQGNCAYQYTVKRGDSYYLIAHRLGVQLRDLLAANPAIPPSRLTVGDVLCVPYGEDVQQPAGDQTPAEPQQPAEPEVPVEPETPAEPETPTNPEPACPANRRTVVQEGQSAGDLQLRYGLSYYTLQSANAGTDLEKIQGGDVLCIPEANTPCPVPKCYTLKEDDTLESVAITYNLPVAALLRANPCLAPKDFCAGVTIKLPE